MAVVTAAQRVFGVTELCETILLALTDDIDTNKEPAKAVFAVQRVCKTFKRTIDGSKELRQLMWLEQKELEFEKAEKEPIAVYGRISWLFEQLSNPVYFVGHDPCVIKHAETWREILESPDYGSYKDRLEAIRNLPTTAKTVERRTLYIELTLEKYLVVPEGNLLHPLRSFLQPEASWRKIDIPTVAGSHPHILVELRVEPIRHFTFGLRQYPQAINVRKDSSLGKLCDSYREIFSRTKEQHLEKIKRYEEALLYLPLSRMSGWS